MQEGRQGQVSRWAQARGLYLAFDLLIWIVVGASVVLLVDAFLLAP